MILWRLTCRPYSDLSGRGGEFADGRWHTRGSPVVYCAGTAALAILEVRVHLDLPLDLLPDDYVLMKIDAPDDLEVGFIGVSELPERWRRSEELCRPFGDAWLRQGSTALLSVPSAIIPVDRNVLLNPRHRATQHVSVAEIAPFGWGGRRF